MNNKLDVTIKLDAQGKPDVDYYLAVAHKLRAEYIGNAIRQLHQWLKSQVKHTYCWLFDCRNALPH